MAHGFLYLMAIMDWHSRSVLSWRLSNTLDSDFCVEALEEALESHGCPEIFNTDQGCQFTSHLWTDILKAHDIRISMDGKGRWMDNVFIERLWRSLSTSASISMHSRTLPTRIEKSIHGLIIIITSGHIRVSATSPQMKSTEEWNRSPWQLEM